MNRKLLAMLMPLAFMLNTLAASAATYVTEPADIRFSAASPSQTFTITTDENPSEIDGTSGSLKVKLKFPKKLFSSDAPKVIELPYTDGVVDVSEPITLTLKKPDKLKKDRNVKLRIKGNKQLKKNFRFSDAVVDAAIEVGATDVSGQVTVPGSSSSSLRRFSTINRGILATNVTVELIRVDEDGNQVGDVIARTTTNANGEYNIEMPEGLVFGPDLVLRVVVDGNEMRAFLADDEVDIDPYSEYIYRECQENTDSLSNLTADEINALTTLIQQFAVDIQDSLDISIANFEEIIGDFIINMIVAANDVDDEDFDDEDEDEDEFDARSFGDKYFVAFFDTGLSGPKTEHSDASTRATMELARAKFSKPNAVGSMKVKGFPVLIAEAELHKLEEFSFGPQPFPGDDFEDFGPGGPDFGPGGPDFGPGGPEFGPGGPQGPQPFADLLECNPTDPNCTHDPNNPPPQPGDPNNPPPQECFDPVGNKIPCDGTNPPPHNGDCGVDESGNPIPCPPTGGECLDAAGNPIPCDNHDPCKDIPPNTSVFFNDGTGFVECPPPDPCADDFPPPPPPGTVPNFDDGIFTECPPVHDPCKDLPPPPEPGTFPNSNDGTFTECPPPQNQCEGGDFGSEPFDPTQPFFEDSVVECPPPDPCFDGGFGPGPFDPDQPQPFFDDDHTGFIECPPLHDDPCKDFGDGFEDFQPFFEDGEFISCTPPHGDPCAGGGFGPGPHDDFDDFDDDDDFETFFEGDDFFECPPEEGPGFGSPPTHFLHAFTFDPLRDRRGPDDHGGIEEFFVNVSPSNVISFIEPARDDIFFDRRDEFVFKNNAVRESFYPVGGGMYISSSTHGGQLFRNGQLLETKQEFGFGAMVQESPVGQSQLAGKYGMVSLGIDLSKDGSIGLLGLAGDVDISATGRATPSFNEVEIFRERDYENSENVPGEVPDFIIEKETETADTDDSASLTINNGKVNMTFDDLDHGGEAEIFEGYVRPDGDVIIFVSKNDRTGEFGFEDDRKGRRKGPEEVTSAGREVTFAIRRGTGMAISDLDDEYVVLCHNIRIEATELVSMSTCDDETSRLSFSAGQAQFSGVSLKTATRSNDEANVSFSKATGPDGVATSTNLSTDGALDITIGDIELKGYASADTNLIILRAENGNELGLYVAIKKPEAPVRIPNPPATPTEE